MYVPCPCLHPCLPAVSPEAVLAERWAEELMAAAKTKRDLPALAGRCYVCAPFVPWPPACRRVCCYLLTLR